jgi:hypothetical protein
MDNPETRTTLRSQDIGRRQSKREKHSTEI